MTKAVLLAFFTHCLSRVSHIAAAPTSRLTCQHGQITSNEVSNVGTFEVVCPDDTKLPQLSPGEPTEQGTVFLKPDDNDNECGPISRIVPGACFGQKQGKNALVVLSQLPGDPKWFYLYCKKDEGGRKDQKDCVIEVVVAASRPLGPNTCSVRGSRIRLAIEKSNETAVFSCGDGRTLQPEDPKKALDEGCAKEVALPATVKLTTKPTKLYEVTASELPKEKTTICYICAKTVPGDSQQDRCQVAISIAASNASGALAVGVAARAAAAVGLTVTLLPSW